MAYHDRRVPRLVLDAETYSTVDLARAGAHAYASHPETDVHCLAWKLTGPGGCTRGLWLPGEPVPDGVRAHIVGRLGWVVAHNYLFELNLLELVLTPRYGWPIVFPDWWSCTMARALYHGLPAGLEPLGHALGLAQLKDPTGRANMLRLARPRALTAAGPTWWKDDPVEGRPRLMQLYAYCAQDTATEAEADERLPELPAGERGIFALDRRINQRGIGIDQPLIHALRQVIRDEGERLNQAVEKATQGAVTTTNQVARLSVWLSANGTPVESLDKASVLDALSQANDVTRPVLLLRQEAAKASTAKLQALHAAASPDDRARGMFQYYGAGRTGRWAGRRAQLQNFPRPILPQALVDLAIRWTLKGLGVDALRGLLPETPMDVVASCLRGCLVAAPGHLLYSVDLAQIEARVIAWLAGQADVLAVFASGQDVYVYTAAKIGSASRTLGKVLCLACGFGMGPPRFQETALQYRVVLSIGQAEAAVYGYRETNDMITKFWYALGDAFKYVATSSSGTSQRVGFLTLRKQGRAVRIALPSGRELVYQDAEIERDEAGRDTLTYMGIHSTTKQWCRLRTYGGKLAENCTQAVARDVMAQAMAVLDRAGHALVASIHDEVIGEAPEAVAPTRYAHALDVFRRTPSWAPGLPVGAAGWVGSRYRKG